MISLFWWHHKLGSHPFERSIHPRRKIYHGIYREFCKLLKHQILSILFIYIYMIFFQDICYYMLDMLHILPRKLTWNLKITQLEKEKSSYKSPFLGSMLVFASVSLKSQVDGHARWLTLKSGLEVHQTIVRIQRLGWSCCDEPWGCAN